MPINSSSIPALRIAREVRRKRRAEGGAVAYDPMSGLQIGGDSSEAAAPDPQGPLSKIASRLTGTQFGEPRYQLWPEKMVRSGAALAGDVLSGEQSVLPPGLRREDYTDKPAPGGMTVAAQPNDPMMERAQDMAGMAGGQTLLTGAREAVPAAQRALVAAADSSATGAPLAALEHAPAFYSGLERTVEAVPQPTMTGQQWLGTLNNKGVKAEEMQWSGLGDYLTAKADQPVSKAEVAEHLGANQVKLGETTLQTQPWDKLSGDEQYAIVDRYNDSHDNIGRPDEIRDWYDEQVQNGELTKGPKYSNWQLPGGENYREKLLTMPEKKIRSPRGEEETARLDAQNNYRSSHWDEPNVLVHRRTNERDVNGQRALHIEEIQSDWHQAGRKKGYDKPVNVEKKPLDAETARRVGLNEGDERYVAERDGRVIGVGETEAEARQYAGTAPKGIPDAPFKKNWHELALKDAIREAAEKGLDRISWTPGEAQAARYDLSKRVQTVVYKDGNLTAIGPTGQHVINNQAVPKEKLPDFIGKEAAEKLINQEPHNGAQTLQGEQLKVGGEGMKGFYDKIIPDAMNKIGKPHGAKVQSGETTGEGGWRASRFMRGLGRDQDVAAHPTHEGLMETLRSQRQLEPDGSFSGKISQNTTPVHYMDIPPSLKEQALKKGFSLFEDSATPGAAISAAEAAAKERALVDELWHGISNVRLPKPIREMSSSHQPIKGQQARERVMRPSDMQGGLLYPLVGDRTVAGSRLKRVNGFKFSDPVEMQGGHGFMAANADTGAAWASGQGVVKRLSNAVRNLAKGEKPVYGVYTAMGERSADFSHHVSDTLTEMLKHTKVTRDGKAAFDDAMRGQAKGFDAAADWPGVGSKKLREYLANAPGAVRNKFAKLMDTRKFQDFGFPSVAEARHAVTDPRLLNEPTGASGLSISRLDPAGRMFKSASQHRSYDTNLGGQYAGGLGTSVPKEVMYPEIVSSLEGYRDKLPGYKPTIDYLMTRTPTGQPTVQHATQQWVDNISKYLQDRGVPGMKAGGSVDAAMDVARCIKRAKGGKVHVGPILGDTDGRADEVPMEVPDGAYVLTADHCSSMGEGNTLSGFKKLNEMFPKSAQARTAKKEPIKRAAGGKVPIYAADGEYVICPEDIVERWGDLDHGHRILDAWQTAERKEHVKTLKNLAPPAQD